jgi:uncharacterized protein
MAIWKIYFTGDIHGSEVCFRKFLRAGEIYDVKTLVIAGDLSGKGMIPLIQRGSNVLVEYGGVQHTLTSQGEIGEYQKMISNAGFYPYLTTDGEVEQLRGDPQRSAQLVEGLVLHRIEQWVTLMDETARKKGYTFYVSPGNDDPFKVDTVLNSTQFVINPEEQVTQVHEQIEMITCGYTHPSPWNTDRELPEEEFYRKLETLASQVKNPARSIFSLHAPPYNTKLDIGPRLSKDFQIQADLGAPPVEHVGSTAVRKLIEVYQPLVAMHGHIHESAGMDKIGKTRCFNPGSEYAQGILRGILLNFEVGKNVQLKSHLSLAG